MPDYSKAKIYKIYSYENDDVYYGSTIETLSQRMSKHRCHYKKYKEGKGSYYTSYQILELTSAKIELIENYPCNSKEELLQREGYYITNNNCVNRNIAGRTKKEWREQNKEQIKEQKKEYYENNKEHIKKYKKEYNETNKDTIKEQNKEYYEINKDKFKEYHKEYYIQNKKQLNEYRKQYYQRKKQEKLINEEDTNIKI